MGSFRTIYNHWMVISQKSSQGIVCTAIELKENRMMNVDFNAYSKGYKTRMGAKFASGSHSTC